MHVKRNLGILLTTGAFVAAVAIPSASAHTDKTPKPSAKPIQTIDATSCGFAIDVFQIVGPQKDPSVTEPNGEQGDITHGKLVLKFVNTTNTKKSSTQDVSGSVKTVNHKGGNLEQLADGRNWWALGPGGQKNTGRPGLFITQGPVDLQVDLGAKTVKSLMTLDPYQLDLCKVLSGKK